MSQGIKKFITNLRKLLTSLLLLLLILIALYVSIGRQLIVWVSDYKLQLANNLSETLHTNVIIGDLEGGWDIFSPTIKASNIHIGDDKQNLQINQLTLEIDIPRSLLNRQIRIAKVYANGVNLQIRENIPDLWSLGGIPRQKDPITPEIILTQLQRFAKISITNSTISIYPHQQSAYTFTNINATLHHFSDEHMRLDGILHIDQDKPLVLSIDANINPQQWQKLKANVYTDIPYINWQKLLPKDMSLPWKIKRLTLGGEVWASIKKGQLHSLTVNTKHNQLTIQHNKNNEVTIKDFAMQAWYDNYKNQSLALQVANLSFIADKTPFKNLDLLLTHNTTNGQEQWQLQANHLNIHNLIAPILALAPLPPITHDIANTVQPKGIINNLKLFWFPQKPLAEQLEFSAKVQNISFNPYQDTVGAGNITGTIKGTIGQGQLQLDADNFWLFIAKIYPKPWPYHHAKANLNWSFNGDTVSIFSPLIKLKGDEGDLTGDMMIRLYPKNDIKNYMDLRVNIANGNASYTPKYIPTKANIDPDLVHWLNTAIKKGDIETGFFQYQGSLDKKTPDTAHTLLLYMKPNNAQINYQAPWYPITQVSGEVFVEPSAIRVLASQGTISNSQLTNIDINIPHVNKSAITHLYLKANIKSDVNDTLRILKSAPPEISHVFKSWQGTGILTGNLQLNIPLKKHHEPIAIAEFATKNAQLNFQPSIPPLTHISGNFRYDSTKGLSSPQVNAYTLGQPIKATIQAEGIKGKPISSIKATGTVDLTTLANWYTKTKQNWPFSGKTPYELQLKIADTNQLSISSQLNGIELNLPAPFTKSTEQKQNLSYHMTFGNQQDTQLQFNYGNLITSAIKLDNKNNLTGELLINQGKASFSNKPGLQIKANLNTVNLKQWQTIINQYITEFDLQSKNQLININAIRSLDLRIGQLSGLGIPTQQAAFYLQPTGEQGWRLDIDSPSLAGRITAPQINNLPYYINLKHLKIPKEILTSFQTKNSNNGLAANKIPNIYLFVHRLFLDDNLIGTVNFKNTSSAQGLQLSNINMNLKGLHIKGDMNWQLGKQTTFKGQLFGENIEQVLKNWDIDSTVTAKSFKVNINGSWDGSPADFALENFTGTLNPQLNTGRLLSVSGSSTNILRVFGILNSEAISRRLRLDFSDLFKAGLSYDLIEGQFTSTNGLFKITKPFQFEGPSMLMFMTGQLNMRNQQIDATLRAGVPIGSNLSIATLAIAPPIGGAMLIVDHFLGDKLMKLAAITYHIKGDWDNPTITLGTH